MEMEQIIVALLGIGILLLSTLVGEVYSTKQKISKIETKVDSYLQSVLDQDEEEAPQKSQKEEESEQAKSALIAAVLEEFFP